jgi:glyoxylase-like metal-dependent hydrolase (beta-lactamase superfamily II)
MQPSQRLITSFQAGMSNAHLIEAETGYVLVDKGSPGHARRIFTESFSFQRKNLFLIYITHAHFDHYGSAAEIRRLTGAPVAIHAADAEDIDAGQVIR